MKLKADNRSLVLNQPKTILTASIAAGVTIITVGSNDGLTNGNYLLIGKIGEEKSEIVKINGAITHGTSLTVTTTIFSHDVDTVVTKIDYDQVRFYHGTTNVASASTALATAQNIDPTEVYSYYEDTTYTTGYGFIRFYNSTSANFSVYSDALNYEIGYSDRTLRKIREKIRRLIKQPDEQNSDFTNDEIDDEIHLAQKEVAHDRLWSFYEKTKSFSSVANQYEYDLASDVFTLFDAKFDTDPLKVITLSIWNKLRWDSDTTGDPTHMCMWGRKARVYPYPSEGAFSTTIDDADDITATDTSIMVDSISGLKTQGKIIIDSEVISYTGLGVRAELDGLHSAALGTITVDDTTDFPSNGTIKIDDEEITYTGKGATTFTGCTRGANSTTPAIHADGSTVTAKVITGCVRGEEGTTATTHSDGATVTERDFIYHFQEDPARLYDETDETAIPDPSIITYKVAAELSETGPTQDRFYQKYNMALKQLRKVDEPKVKSSFGTVVDATSRGVQNQNDYPTNLTGA